MESTNRLFNDSHHVRRDGSTVGLLGARRLDATTIRDTLPAIRVCPWDYWTTILFPPAFVGSTFGSVIVSTPL